MLYRQYKILDILHTNNFKQKLKIVIELEK